MARQKSWHRVLLRIGGSLGILGLLFFFLPLADLGSAIGRVPLHMWFLGVAGYLIVHLAGVLKWKLVIDLGGARLTTIEATRCYFTGLFGNTFLPSVVGGDLIRGGLAWRISGDGTAVVVGSLVDRLVDVVSLALMAAAGLVLLPYGRSVGGEKVLWIFVSATAIGSVLLLALWIIRSTPSISLRIRNRLESVCRAIVSVSNRPLYLISALGLSLVVQTGLVALNAWMGASCGLHIPFSVWLFAWPLSKLSALTPLTQGGIGVREAALAALLAPFGVPPVLAVAVGLVWEAVLIMGSLAAGILTFVLGRLSPLAATKAGTVSSPI